MKKHLTKGKPKTKILTDEKEEEKMTYIQGKKTGCYLLSQRNMAYKMIKTLKNQ